MADGVIGRLLERSIPGALRGRAILALFRGSSMPIDLRLVGRMLLHAALIGAAAGAIGSGFFAVLEYTQHLLLERAAGYSMLRAQGETFVDGHPAGHFRWWLLLFIPAVGALLAGLVTRLAPETRGGGGDEMIRAFHHQGGVVRRRVLWVKTLASILTLGTGGSGGREGPTMQIGAALGSTVGRLLRVTARERRILMVAGVAAGMAAVFRTPLGAALLAVEVLYRDDFESDALVPAILASVTAYSVVISIFGESTLFGRPPRFAFHAAHLPLYAILAVLIAVVASAFVRALHFVEKSSERLPGPAWLRPGVGGLALGAIAVPVILFVGGRLGVPGQGLGLLGGGYGAAQMAVSGSTWLPSGWGSVELLLLLCAAKLVVSSLTIGSGGSAGDFAPSLVIGGIFGGAFGHAAQLLLHDPRIDPGAFALVGMGTFYGGIANVPVSSLILVSELAGSYDLLVPLMLAEGIAFVALRGKALYRAQVATKRESPVHREPIAAKVSAMRVSELLDGSIPFACCQRTMTASEVLARFAASDQPAFPVVDETDHLVGVIQSEILRRLAAEGESSRWLIAADMMQPPVSVHLDDSVQDAAELMLTNGLRGLPVVDEDGHVLGVLDEAEAVRAVFGPGAATAKW